MSMFFIVQQQMTNFIQKICFNTEHVVWNVQHTWRCDDGTTTVTVISHNAEVALHRYRDRAKIHIKIVVSISEERSVY